MISAPIAQVWTSTCSEGLMHYLQGYCLWKPRIKGSSSLIFWIGKHQGKSQNVGVINEAGTLPAKGLVNKQHRSHRVFQLSYENMKLRERMKRAENCDSRHVDSTWMLTCMTYCETSTAFHPWFIGWIGERVDFILENMVTVSVVVNVSLTFYYSW